MFHRLIALLVFLAGLGLGGLLLRFAFLGLCRRLGVLFFLLGWLLLAVLVLGRFLFRLGFALVLLILLILLLLAVLVLLVLILLALLILLVLLLVVLVLLVLFPGLTVITLLLLLLLIPELLQ